MKFSKYTLLILTLALLLMAGCAANYNKPVPVIKTPISYNFEKGKDTIDLSIQSINITVDGSFTTSRFLNPATYQIDPKQIETMIRTDLRGIGVPYSKNTVNMDVSLSNFNTRHSNWYFLIGYVMGIAPVLFMPHARNTAEGILEIQLTDPQSQRVIYYDSHHFKMSQMGALFYGMNYRKTVNAALKEAVQHMKTNILSHRDEIMYAHSSYSSPQHTSRLERSTELRNTTSLPPADIAVNIPKTALKRKDAVAVVIGNADYLKTTGVDFAIRDASVMKMYLTNALGFDEKNIIFELNASKATLETIFGTENNHRGKLFNWIKKDVSDVFIYYVGHGAPDLKRNRAYIVPVDSDPMTIDMNGYPLDTFYSNIAKLPYKTITVVIDACFSGLSPKGLLVKGISPAGIEVDIPYANIPKSTVFLSSSGKEYSSWHEDQGHSLFTYYFLKGLKGEADKNGDRKISVAELRNYLDEEVPYQARRLNSNEQSPLVWGDLDSILAEY